VNPHDRRNPPLIVAIGEPLVQFAPTTGQGLDEADRLGVHLGGAEVNVMVTLARFGLPVGLLTRLGDDPFGRRILRDLERAGVDTAAVTLDASLPTGVYFKDFRGGRSASYYYRAGSAAASISKDDLQRLPADADWVHVTGITSALSPTCSAVVDALLDRRGRGGPGVSFDVNVRPKLWIDRDPSHVLLGQARRAEVVFVGRDEAHLLWGTDGPDDIRSLLSEVPTLVVKDAAHSAVSFRGTHRLEVPALEIEVIEPVGAGDAFAAGYLAARFEGRDERTALRWGHLLAACTMRSPADQCEVHPRWLLEQATMLSDDEWHEWRPSELDRVG
jgi:2-dehydro-3-deoxygluconokinase